MTNEKSKCKKINQHIPYSLETLLEKCFIINIIKRRYKNFKIRCNSYIYEESHCDDLIDTSNLTEKVPKIQNNGICNHCVLLLVTIGFPSLRYLLDVDAVGILNIHKTIYS